MANGSRGRPAWAEVPVVVVVSLMALLFRDTRIATTVWEMR